MDWQFPDNGKTITNNILQKQKKKKKRNWKYLEIVLTFDLIVLLKEIPAYLLTGRKYKEPAYKVRTIWFGKH